jgi:hypothetical protein
MGVTHRPQAAREQRAAGGDRCRPRLRRRGSRDMRRSAGAASTRRACRPQRNRRGSRRGGRCRAHGRARSFPARRRALGIPPRMGGPRRSEGPPCPSPARARSVGEGRPAGSGLRRVRRSGWWPPGVSVLVLEGAPGPAEPSGRPMASRGQPSRNGAPRQCVQGGPQAGPRLARKGASCETPRLPPHAFTEWPVHPGPPGRSPRAGLASLAA